VLPEDVLKRRDDVFPEDRRHPAFPLNTPAVDQGFSRLRGIKPVVAGRAKTTTDKIAFFRTVCRFDIGYLTAALRARRTHPIRSHCLAPTPGQAGAGLLSFGLSRRLTLQD